MDFYAVFSSGDRYLYSGYSSEEEVRERVWIEIEGGMVFGTIENRFIRIERIPE